MRIHPAWSRLVVPIVLSATLAISAQAQIHFIQTVPSNPAEDFQTLASFSSPATAPEANRFTVIKLVTDGTGKTFQVQRNLDDLANVEADGPAAQIVEGVATDVATVIAFTADGSPPCSPDTPVSGYTITCVVIQYADTYDFSGGTETWQLKVQQDPTSALEYFGWVSGIESSIAAGEAAATRPAIDAEPDLDFGTVQVGILSDVAPVLAPAIRNVGTGPLSITGGPITGDPGFTTDVFAVSPIDPAGSLPSDHGANQGIWVMARPTQLGDRTGTLTLQAGSESMPVTLTATGVTLFSHILLDCSGSMDREPSGPFTSNEIESRLYQAKQAGKEINNWIEGFSEGQAYVGLSTFPGCGAGHVQLPIDRATLNSSNIDSFLNLESAGGLGAGGLTPMQAGIEAAVADMDARIASPSQPNAADRPDLLQAILLFSDGGETGSSDARSTIPTLESKGIRRFTVGYGVPGSVSVDHDLLADLAGGTGEFWDANAMDPFALKQAFKNAVLEWLQLESVVDPTGTIRAGQSRTHTVCVDPRAYGVSFVVDWDRSAAGGVQLTLESPTGETITPSSSGGVDFYQDGTFAQYVIRGDRVRGGAGAGEWTLRLQGGQSIPGNQETRYAYGAVAQTPIRVVPTRPWDLVTGVEPLIEIALPGWPDEYLEGAVINAQYEAPVQSVGTYLAQGEVEPSWFFQAERIGGPTPTGTPLQAAIAPRPSQQPQQVDSVRVPMDLMGEPASPAQRKAWALANLADRPFPNERETGTLQLVDDGTNGDRVAGDGIFTARAPQLRVDGIYDYAISVTTPELGRRRCINRDVRWSDFVAVHLSPELVREHVTWHTDVGPDLFFDPRFGRELAEREPAEGMTRSAVVYTPQDEFGNLWGPGRADDLVMEVSNGEPLTPIVDQYDGSYVRVVEHAEDARPEVVIQAAGVTSPAIPFSEGAVAMWWLWALLLLVIVLVLVAWRRLAS